MPLPRAPWKSGAHSIAGIALFRALLVQCGRQPHASDALGSIVRNRFRTNAHLISPKQLSDAFDAGYEALDILRRAATGDAKCCSMIQNLIERIPERLKTAVPLWSRIGTIEENSGGKSPAPPSPSIPASPTEIKASDAASTSTRTTPAVSKSPIASPPSIPATWSVPTSVNASSTYNRSKSAASKIPAASPPSIPATWSVVTPSDAISKSSRTTPAASTEPKISKDTNTFDQEGPAAIHDSTASDPASTSSTAPQSLDIADLKLPATPAQENRDISPLAARHPILLRPYPQISGRRRVPVWTRGHGIPFIRIKKPQPHALTVAIRTRYEKRQVWLDWRADLQQRGMRFAEYEDEWDELLAQEGIAKEGVVADGVGEEPEGIENSWKRQLKLMIDELTHKLWEQTRQNHELSEAMFEVVQKEKALAREERKAEKAARREARAKTDVTNAELGEEALEVVHGEAAGESNHKDTGQIVEGDAESEIKKLDKEDVQDRVRNNARAHEKALQEKSGATISLVRRVYR